MTLHEKLLHDLFTLSRDKASGMVILAKSTCMIEWYHRKARDTYDASKTPGGI